MSKIWKILSAHGYIYHRLHTTNFLIQSHIGRKDKSATMIKLSLFKSFVISVVEIFNNNSFLSSTTHFVNNENSMTYSHFQCLHIFIYGMWTGSDNMHICLPLF
jgi:hypothetical protein